MISADQRPYEPFGAARDLWTDRRPELLLSGPAGTGKSRACLEKIHACCLRWPGARCLIVRKTRESLTETALVTFEEKVLPANSPIASGPRRSHRQAYQYPSGSTIVVGGLDKPGKVMSTEYDLIYCFVGETRICSPSTIERAYRREYSGPLVTIRTAGGNELTGTPNHPILTDKGWVALGELHEGSNVVCRRRAECSAPIEQPDVDDQPATIAEIAESLLLSPSSLAERIEGVGVDFHGDGTDNDVDIVTAASHLESRFKSALAKHVGEANGVRRNLESMSLVRLGTFGELLVGPNLPPVALAGLGTQDAESFAVGLRVDPRLDVAIGRLSELDVPFGAGISDMTLPLAFAHGARGESPATEFGLQRGVAQANRGSNLDEAALSGEITLDRVIHFDRADQPAGASRHVYNLQTSNHYYFANNIIAHNCQEAIEVYENDWESLTTRLRNNVVPFQQLIADTNPDRPTHWLKLRVDRGSTAMLESRHEDNPTIWDRARGEPTERGRDYLAKLDALTGARKPRLRYGKWVQAEGVVYDGWDRQVHLIDRFAIPDSWRRIRAIDFGYSNPFVCLWVAIDDDCRMYVYRELYHTKRTVRVHAEQIGQLSGDERYEFTVADHDAEDRATLREADIGSIPARKDISPGIEAVTERLKVAGDGRPRLYVFRDCLVERDESLVEAKRPCSIVEEFDSYSWPKAPDGKAVKEQPEKLHDHAMDSIRYACMAIDRGVTAILPPAVIEAREKAEAERLEAEHRDVRNESWWNGGGGW